MTTDTAGTTARELPTQQVHYLRKKITYATAGIATGVKFPNPIPAGAQILSAVVNVTTAFTGGTPILTIGQNASSYNDIVASADVTEGSTGATTVLRGGDLTFAADTDLYVMLTNTGTGLTGEATLVVTYVPDNDA